MKIFNTSIYNKLLKTIIGVFLLLWLLAVFFTRGEIAHEIEELFDAHLSHEAAILFHGFVVNAHAKQQANQVVEELSFGHEYSSKVGFQIWQDNTLILRSSNVPGHSFRQGYGYSDVVLEGERWRAFSTDKKLQNIEYTIVIAEKYDIRNELIEEILYNSIAPLLLVLPLLIILLHFAIKRGLSSLPQITQLVKNKQSNDFSAIELNAIPDEIKALIDAFNQLMQRLKVAFERESRFTMNAAHELRTPIASIKLQAQLAQVSLDNPEQLKHALQQVISGSHQSSYLIDQMLTLARLEPAFIQQKMEKADIITSIKKSISEYVAQALKKNINIEFYANVEECYLRHYPQAVVIMLNNLIHNAVKFTPDNGLIKVRLIDTDSSCIVSVKDSGSGISENEKHMVFERHYRSLEQKNKGGCGLGLSIVKQIVNLHQANISLSNDNGLNVSIKFNKQMTKELVNE